MCVCVCVCRCVGVCVCVCVCEDRLAILLKNIMYIKYSLLYVIQVCSELRHLRMSQIILERVQ